MLSINSKYIFESGAAMFFRELSCNNKTIKVTENNCKIIPEIIKIRLEAHPGIA